MQLWKFKPDVILRGYTKSNNYYGVYVGASRNEPEIRFNQHKVILKYSRFT